MTIKIDGFDEHELLRIDLNSSLQLKMTQKKLPTGCGID